MPEITRDPSTPIVGFVRILTNFTVSMIIVLLMKIGIEESIAKDISNNFGLFLQALVMAMLGAVGKIARDNPDRWFSFIGKLL